MVYLRDGAADADRQREAAVYRAVAWPLQCPGGDLRPTIAQRIKRAMLKDLMRTAKAGLEMLLHLVLALIAAGCLKLSELAWTWLFPGPQPLVLGLFPYRWILDFGDVAIIVVFTGFAIYNAIRIMGEK